MEDKLLNFVSKVIIGFTVLTIVLVWLGNFDKKVSAPTTSYPVSYELDGYTLRFENQEDMIGYFLGYEYTK